MMSLINYKKTIEQQTVGSVQIQLNEEAFTHLINSDFMSEDGLKIKCRKDDTSAELNENQLFLSVKEHMGQVFTFNQIDKKLYQRLKKAFDELYNSIGHLVPTMWDEPNSSSKLLSPMRCRFYNYSQMEKITKITVQLNRDLFEWFGGRRIFLNDITLLFVNNHGIAGMNELLKDVPDENRCIFHYETSTFRCSLIDNSEQFLKAFQTLKEIYLEESGALKNNSFEWKVL
jgi:hypothetical protein